MIGLDTNVLVRYLTQDDPDQAATANRVILEQCTPETPCRVSLIVLCELVWVLRSAYGHERATIATTLEGILTAAELEVEQEDVAWQAWRTYRDGSAEFADYCILFANREAGCNLTFTFDRKLREHPEAGTPGT